MSPLSTSLFTLISVGLAPHGKKAKLKPLADSNIYVMVHIWMLVYVMYEIAPTVPNKFEI